MELQESSRRLEHSINNSINSRLHIIDDLVPYHFLLLLELMLICTKNFSLISICYVDTKLRRDTTLP